MSKITTINIFRVGGEWCYATFTSEGFDESDTVGVDNDATEEEVRAEIRSQYSRFPDVVIRRIEDK